MLSFGILAARALSTIKRRAALSLGSEPPALAAINNSRDSFWKILPRFASWALFLPWMLCHFECPDISVSFFHNYCKPHIILSKQLRYFNICRSNNHQKSSFYLSSDELF